jgi:ketosteroid isomerase-like protein
VSQANVEVVRRGFEAYRDGDLDAVVTNFAEDVHWRLIGGFAGLMGEEFTGRDGVLRFFAEFNEILGDRAEVESLLDAGEQVVAIVRTEGAGDASGAPAAMRWGQVFTFREGTICEVDNYYDAGEALEAVGLRE